MSKLLKVEEVMEMLGMSRASLYRRMQDGEIDCVADRGKRWFLQEHIDAYIEAHRTDRGGRTKRAAQRRITFADSGSVGERDRKALAKSVRDRLGIAPKRSKGR